MSDRSELRKAFASVPQFERSPLYTRLGPVVAGDDFLLELAAMSRVGQQPTFLFFGAVHYLLLSGADHELKRFYASVVGDAVLPSEGAAAPFVSFCHAYRDELAALLEERLVQTNAVPRSLALWLGAVVIHRFTDAPIHLVDVGASAGIHLRFNQFGYTLGGSRFGDANSSVQLEAEWQSDAPVPVLDAIPSIASATGVDLHPVDASSVEQRRWLEALVWPDNRPEAELLEAALRVIASDLPDIRAGDAIDVCPQLAAELPPDEPRVVFHSATRMHIPAQRRAAFDGAIRSLGENAPLYVLTLERPPDPDPRPQPARPGAAVYLCTPSGQEVLVAVVGTRVEWVEPVKL
jgi:Uncharacterized protein conserved in bacteria